MSTTIERASTIGIKKYEYNYNIQLSPPITAIKHEFNYFLGFYYRHKA
jgi:hypothetical protein